MDEPNPSALRPTDAPQSPPTNSEPQPGPRPPSTAEMMFLGSDGLRSGWSLLLYFLIGSSIAAGFRFLLHLPFVPHFSKLWGFFVAECLSLTAALVPAFIMAKIEKRSFGAYGLPIRQAFGKLAMHSAEQSGSTPAATGFGGSTMRTSTTARCSVR